MISCFQALLSTATGYRHYITAANITDQKHKLTLDYIRGMRQRRDGGTTVMDVGYFNADSVLKTVAA